MSSSNEMHSLLALRLHVILLYAPGTRMHCFLQALIRIDADTSADIDTSACGRMHIWTQPHLDESLIKSPIRPSTHILLPLHLHPLHRANSSLAPCSRAFQCTFPTPICNTSTHATQLSVRIPLRLRRDGRTTATHKPGVGRNCLMSSETMRELAMPARSVHDARSCQKLSASQLMTHKSLTAILARPPLRPMR
jgi:hypothetical protein